MQGNSPKKPRSLDGFIGSRPHRTVGSAPQARPFRHVAEPSPSQVLRRAIHQRPPTTQAVQRPTAGDSLINKAIPPSAGKGNSSLLASRSKRLQRPGIKSQKQPKPRWRRVTKRAVLVCLAFMFISVGWMGWKFYRNTSKVFGNKNPLAVLSAFKPVPLKGESTGHVNILLAGDSADRTDDSGGGNLTDSIMVLSINTKTHAAYMLSVPRDLWVVIPGVGGSKINAANTLSSFSESGYPAGGMGALEKVINDNLGIAVNYYALVNYTAFKDAVNQVGGIDVTIQSPDPRGIYDPSFRGNEGSLKLPNGVDHLDGQTALNLARARGDPYNGVYGAYGFPNSDFDRTDHQRQMMLALKEKGMGMSVLSNPLKIGGLMDAVGNNVKTDFQINELASLYYMFKNIKSTDIQSLSLNSADGQNLLANYTATGGQSALAPAAGVDDFSQIQAYIAKEFNATAVTKEAAKVVVLNGGKTAGLGKSYGDVLIQKGANVTSVGDASSDYNATTIIDNSGGKKPATKSMLSSMFGNSSFSANASANAPLIQQYPGDFIVILGASQQAPDSSASSSSASASSSSNI